MLIGDVFDQMIINRDMVLVTDIKSMEISKEDRITQFKELVSEANKRDKELLDRVIPQIYHQRDVWRNRIYLSFQARDLYALRLIR